MRKLPPCYGVVGYGDLSRVCLGTKRRGDTPNEIKEVFYDMLDRLSFPLDYADELVFIYGKHRSLGYRMRSLCAGVLYQWTDRKIPLAEFSEKCGVSKSTIAKVCKQISNK